MGPPDTPRHPPGTEAGPPMQQKHIEFRELLERILPLHELPAVDRFRVQAALRGGMRTDLEQAALLALSRLEQRGTLERIPGAAGGKMRWRRLDTPDVITLEVPGIEEANGIRVIPRAALPREATAGLDDLRGLLRLDDALLISDPRSGQARLTLIEQLTEAGRTFLGARELRFVAADESARPLEPELAARARRDPTRLLYCPDLGHAPSLAAHAGDARALVMAGVPGADGTTLGHLELTSDLIDPWPLESLALVALLADVCGGALERAARIESLVFVDPLTSVFNRAYFDRQIENEMARAQRDGTSMALAIADIDNFKSFNTQFGYEAGNQVLRHVAERLRHALRPFDTVARWGGEEFAILLTAPVLAEDAATVCDRLRMAVGGHMLPLEGLEQDAHEVRVTMSIGVAMYPDHASSAAELWRAANRALLEAKRPPKDQVVFYRAG